jgi:hypothetical protein
MLAGVTERLRSCSSRTRRGATTGRAGRRPNKEAAVGFVAATTPRSENRDTAALSLAPQTRPLMRVITQKNTQLGGR